MDERPVVLVAARETVIRRLVAAALRPAGFSIAESDTDHTLLERASDTHPDVLIVEATEPQTATVELLRQLRREISVPILLMSAFATPTRVAPALDAGADDYIARPFNPSELAARVRALVRRRGNRLRAGRRRVGQAIVDLVSRRVSCDGTTSLLGRAEWTLLTVLLANEGRVMFFDELIGAAFGADHLGDLTHLQLSIARLRRKLGLSTWDEGPIRTVRGFGYAYDPGGMMRRFRSQQPDSSVPAATTKATK
jgi:DNA-binding response OmpR family regulator